MELSMLIAKILAVIYISSGIAVLIGTFKMSDFVIEFEKSPALTFVSGCVAIILGMILVTYHNIWVGNWRVIITIISWIMLVGGVSVVIIPKSLFFMKGLIKDNRLWGLFMLIFGMLIGYFGFFV
ncbi:MAG: hypothetical protein M0R34_07070 [Candidatus Marinimicrobia bacterium]|nr:hypothetical protein [Candidatus Neomarinimicrobiota bacterium]MCK9484108.1 hypothetical protein [Candidatus Neomarinimicrobiota bacterium]